VSITIKKNLKSLKTFSRDVKKNFSRKLKDDIADEIIVDIIQGKSPVRNHTFKPYKSIKYKGRKRPVDMFKTGDLLKSIHVKQNRLGEILVSFKDEKAEWHQEGQGKLPVRKLLPVKRGEKFNIRLTKFINKILKLAVKKAVKKQ